MASKQSVSALINTSEHIKNPSSSFHGSAESLSRGLWLHLDSDPKSAAASGSKTLPLQRPGSLHLFNKGHFPPGHMEKKHLSRTEARKEISFKWDGRGGGIQ